MKRTAFTLIELLFILFILVILIAIILPALNRVNPAPKRSVCALNLKEIYMGMVHYGQDYDGYFPVIDRGSDGLIGEDKVVFNRIPGEQENPFKDIPVEEGRSISQNLWLLVRNDFIQPDVFNCPSSEPSERKFIIIDRDKKISEWPLFYVDFPYKKSGTTISYSFVQPWTTFDRDKKKGSWDMWSADTDCRLIIGADENNGKQPNFPLTTMPASQPANKDDIKQYINSTNHICDGQNMLYGDGHVNFEKSPYVGINQDNIYTAQPEDYTGEAGRTPGILNVRPKNEFDTVLIPNHEDGMNKKSSLAVSFGTRQ